MNLTEQRHILSLIAGSSKRVEGAALATIVRTEGSTYRRPGARLLVDPTGAIAGNLSGGCLEGEVAIEAERVLRDGKPALLLYDLSADDEAIWGWGLGCNGTMEVFIEPTAAWRDPARLVSASLDAKRAVGVATTLTSPGQDLTGSHVVVDSMGSVALSSGDPQWDKAIARQLGDALAGRRCRLIQLEGRRVFLEPLLPADVAIIFGAGHDSVPLTDLCSYLGFEVVVVDERTSFLNERRFPKATDFCEPGDLDGLIARHPEAALFAVVMSHNYLKDLDALERLLKHGLTYLGVLGPRKRLDRLMRDLRAKGAVPDDAAMEAVYGPAGLDLGGEGPEEVALSIAAELLALRNGRAGGFLRDRKTAIHDRAQ